MPRTRRFEQLVTLPQLGDAEYGTADVLADVLGISPRDIWNWRKRDGLATHHIDDQGRGYTLSPLQEAAEIEARKRARRRARPGALDIVAVGR